MAEIEEAFVEEEEDFMTAEVGGLKIGQSQRIRYRGVRRGYW